MSRSSPSIIVNDRIANLEAQLLTDNAAVKESIHEIGQYISPRQVLQRFKKNAIGNKRFRAKLISFAGALTAAILVRKLFRSKL